jgi:RHS repeat-associated protein
VRAITDETGAVVIRRDYAPFGEDSNPDLTGDPMRFAGKELDPETGMNYFAARYYRNTWGRFASVDPVSGWASDPQSWNRYAYARNNPLRYVDPSGLSYWTCTDGCFWVHETWENFSTLMEQYGQHTYGDRSGGRIYDDFGREGTYDYHCYLVCDGGRPYPPNDPPPSPPPPDDDPPSRCALALSACPKPPDNEDKGPKNKDPGKALRPVPDPPGADRAWQWASRVKDAGRATGGIPVMSLPRRRWRSRDRRAREQRGAIS